MTRITVNRQIHAPVELVFATVADIREFAKVLPHVVKYEFLSETTSGLGPRFRETRLMNGKAADTELEITECADNLLPKLMNPFIKGMIQTAVEKDMDWSKSPVSQGRREPVPNMTATANRCFWLLLPLLFGGILLLAAASSGLAAERKPNVLLLCVDDLRPELACFGKPYIHSPNIDRLAASGRAFHRHYVQAPTCGASRYTLLTGRYGPVGNGALFARARDLGQNPATVKASLPAWLRKHGYVTVSVGKVSHHPGGRGGKDWNASDQPEMPFSWDRHLMPIGPWQHPRGAMHGLANGQIRIKAGEMDVYQAIDGPDSIYPDGLITSEALRQLDRLSENQADQPFLLAVGIIRPHLPFGAPKKYLQLYEGVELPPIPHPTKPQGKTTWHGSGEFMKYNRWQRDPNADPEFADHVRRHYAACVSYADAQIGRILQRLDSLHLRGSTLIVLWGDHGWHLGEHAIWGKHSLFEESLRSPLIISHPEIALPGQASQSVVETLDIFPTLCDLAGLPIPDFAQGVSLRPILDAPDAPGHTAISYGKANTIRTESHRLIAHQDGSVELYDHTSPAKETRNIAGENPALVRQLLTQLQARLP